MRDWAAVLFDLDGTLADTIPLILRCYRHTMLTHRGEALPDDLWVRHIGKPLRVTMTHFASDAEEAERMIATYVAFQRSVHDEIVCAFPGAVPAVDAFRARGVRTGVVTSKGREMTGRTLACCGLERMDVLVTADDVRQGKPHPEPVLKAISELGLEDRPEDVLFVGDSPYDLVAGREAGVRTAAVLWGPFGREVLAPTRPDHWVEAWEELLDLVPGGAGGAPSPDGVRG